MPRRAKGARLYFERARYARDGRLLRAGVYVIRDGLLKRSTGFGQGEIEQAEGVLAEYLIARYQPPREKGREPASVRVADVIAIYAEDVAAKHARPKETAVRLERLLNYFGEATLDQINRKACEKYVADRLPSSSARRELEDLRAAIRCHWQNGYCSSLTPVVLPRRSEPRERWLSRQEAARLLWAAWRLRQKQFGAGTDRATAQHIARFILIGLYTGTRAGAICRASFEPGPNRAWVDLERGVFHRPRPITARPINVSRRLDSHRGYSHTFDVGNVWVRLAVPS